MYFWFTKMDVYKWYPIFFEGHHLVATVLCAGSPAKPLPPAAVEPVGGGGAEALAETQPGTPQPDMERQVDQDSDVAPTQELKAPEPVPEPDTNSTQLECDKVDASKALGVTAGPEHEPKPSKRKPNPDWNTTDATGDDSVYASASIPPQELTERAIYMRLHRVFKKRKDGTFILDDEWNKAWLDVDGGGRESLYAIFEKVGYDRDRFLENHSVCSIYWCFRKTKQQ